MPAVLVLMVVIAAPTVPRIESIDSPYAATAGGASIHLRGAGFIEGVRTFFARHGEHIELACKVISSSILGCVVPRGAPGPVDVVITTAEGSSDTHVGAFTYFRINRVSPSHGPAEGGTPVSIAGRFFPRNTEILFGGERAACVWKDPSKINCITPAGPIDEYVDVDARPSDEGQVPSRLVRGYLYEGELGAMIARRPRQISPAESSDHDLASAWSPEPPAPPKRRFAPPTLERPPNALIFPQPIWMPGTPDSPRSPSSATSDDARPTTQTAIEPKRTILPPRGSADSIFAPIDETPPMRRVEPRSQVIR